MESQIAVDKNRKSTLSLIGFVTAWFYQHLNFVNVTKISDWTFHWNSIVKSKLEASKKTSWRESVYISLFKSKRYTLMFLCDTMGFFAYMIVMQYLTDKMTHAGLVRTDATWCIAILGIANTVSKLVCGFLCNKVSGKRILTITLEVLTSFWNFRWQF